MVYSPTFTIKFKPNVGEYTIHGFYGLQYGHGTKKNLPANDNAAIGPLFLFAGFHLPGET